RPAATARSRLPAGWAAGLHEPGGARAGGRHPARRLLARPRAPVRPWAPVRPGWCQPRACPRRRRSQTARPGGRATARTIPSAVSAASAPWLGWSPARFTTTPGTCPDAPGAGPVPPRPCYGSGCARGVSGPDVLPGRARGREARRGGALLARPAAARAGTGRHRLPVLHHAVQRRAPLLAGRRERGGGEQDVVA